VEALRQAPNPNGREEKQLVNGLTVVGLEWLGGLALFLGFIVFVRYLDHRERMSMIERGLVPGPRVERLRPARGSAVLRGGLITAAVGVTVTFGLYTLGYLLPPPFNAVPGRFGPWLLPGLIPLGVGVALVASYYLAPPRAVQGNGDHDGEMNTAMQGGGRNEKAGRGLRVLDAARDDSDQSPMRDSRSADA
jgi:hypothetical protein